MVDGPDSPREAWGVCGVNDAVLYEPDMPLEAARRIVQIENAKQDEYDFPRDWEDMAGILDAEGISY